MNSYSTSMIIYSAVLLHYQRVRNGQTDTQTICIAPRRENLVKLSGKSEILNDGEILWGQMCGIIQEPLISSQTPSLKWRELRMALLIVLHCSDDWRLNSVFNTIHGMACYYSQHNFIFEHNFVLKCRPCLIDVVLSTVVNVAIKDYNIVKVGKENL